MVIGLVYDKRGGHHIVQREKRAQTIVKKPKRAQAEDAERGGRIREGQPESTRDNIDTLREKHNQSIIGGGSLRGVACSARPGGE